MKYSNVQHNIQTDTIKLTTKESSVRFFCGYKFLMLFDTVWLKSTFSIYVVHII